MCWHWHIHVPACQHLTRWHGIWRHLGIRGRRRTTLCGHSEVAAASNMARWGVGEWVGAAARCHSHPVSCTHAWATDQLFSSGKAAEWSCEVVWRWGRGGANLRDTDMHSGCRNAGEGRGGQVHCLATVTPAFYQSRNLALDVGVWEHDAQLRDYASLPLERCSHRSQVPPTWTTGCTHGHT